MATLTHPDDTGTLDRAAVDRAARDAEADQVGTVPTEALDAPAEKLHAWFDDQAEELRAWLDARGTVDEDEPAGRLAVADPIGPAHGPFPAGVPAILVHQHVWPATPEAFRPGSTSDPAALDALVDRALAPAVPADVDGWPALDSAGSTALPDESSHAVPHELDEIRRRTLGWAVVVGAWLVATALVVPLGINAIVGSIDLTIDLGGDGQVVAEDAATDGAPAGD